MRRVNYPAIAIAIFIGVYIADVAATATKYYVGRKMLRDAFDDSREQWIAETKNEVPEVHTSMEDLPSTLKYLESVDQGMASKPKSMKIVIGQAEADAHRARTDEKIKQRSKTRLIMALFCFGAIAAPIGGLAWYVLVTSPGREGLHDWQRGH